MDVFLVPVGRDAYELYCEHVDDPEDEDEAGDEPARDEVRPVDDVGGAGAWVARLFARLKAWPLDLFARLKAQFQQMLAEAERERRHANVSAPRGNWLQRARRRGMRWVVESIAEQRLLWNLRRHVEATLHYP